MSKYAIVGSSRLARHLQHYFKILGTPASLIQDSSSISESQIQSDHVILTQAGSKLDEFLDRNYPVLRMKNLVHTCPTYASRDTAWIHPLASFPDGFKDVDYYRSITFATDPKKKLSDVLVDLPNEFIEVPQKDRVHLHSLMSLTTDTLPNLLRDISKLLQGKHKLPKALVEQLMRNMLENMSETPESDLESQRMLSRAHAVALRKSKIRPIFDTLRQTYHSKPKMTVETWQKYKEQGHKTTILVAFDSTSCHMIDESSIDAVLAGDSVAMNCFGNPNTLSCDVDTMVAHTRACAKGLKNTFLVADLPFMTYHGGIERLSEVVRRLVAAGAEAVKLEGGTDHCIQMIKHIIDSGVPVMGHLGLTPQFVHQFGGFRVQGREADTAKRIKEQALKVQEAGCFSVALECVPADLAKEVTDMLDIPTIGVGAGPHCDSQGLILQDALGMHSSFKPKFARAYMPGFETICNALDTFHADVQTGRFPDQRESFK